MTRSILSLLLLALLLVACTRQVHVLTGPPQTAYRTLGMVSGQGGNEASAIQALVNEAAKIEADAVIITGQRPVGQVIIVSGRAIRYTGPPPE